ncbi:hypothetical protein J6590_050451 [Homalodisca vitripennis]|nr:hypothetical protein J6590_050451 [Homalodisca vitripennis]
MANYARLIINQTDETLISLTWEAPSAPNGALRDWTITATMVETFSQTPVSPRSWTYPVGITRARLLGLTPATRYNITICVGNSFGTGPLIYELVWTHIAEPTQPDTPEVLKKGQSTITVKLKPVINEFGPVSRYKIIVSTDERNFFEDNCLKSWIESQNDNLTYYITAELCPKAQGGGTRSNHSLLLYQGCCGEGGVCGPLVIEKTVNLTYAYYEVNSLYRRLPPVIRDQPDVLNETEFVVGDGKRYSCDSDKSWYNVPLASKDQYHVSLGIVSSFQGLTKTSYSSASPSHNGVILLYAPPDEEDGVSEGLLTFLKIAIVIGGLLLVMSIVIFLLIRRKYGGHHYRRRDQQELNIRGAVTEVENSAFVYDEYLPEEEERKVDYYDMLHQRIWNIPRNFLDIWPEVLSEGSFGTIYRGTVQRKSQSTDVAIYAILDSELATEDKRSMLEGLDILVRGGDHYNTLSLTGTCESQDTLYIVMEYHPATLKDVLLQSRCLQHGENPKSKFCSLSESAVFEFIVGIAQGMDFLASKKIVHKQLSCSNVLMADGVIPKITGFGVAQFNRTSKKPPLLPRSLQECQSRFGHLPNTKHLLANNKMFTNSVPQQTMFVQCRRILMLFKSYSEKQDYTRWSAQEVLARRIYVTKSDVWSFGILVWEVCALGGTPYRQTANEQVAGAILRGLRLHQLHYVGDSLYQFMLQCWQIDVDERPSFPQILTDLNVLCTDSENK